MLDCKTENAVIYYLHPKSPSPTLSLPLPPPPPPPPPYNESALRKLHGLCLHIYYVEHRWQNVKNVQFIILLVRCNNYNFSDDDDDDDVGKWMCGKMVYFKLPWGKFRFTIKIIKISTIWIANLSLCLCLSLSHLFCLDSLTPPQLTRDSSKANRF